MLIKIMISEMVLTFTIYTYENIINTFVQCILIKTTFYKKIELKS